MELQEIQIKGARQHNLQNISVNIPKRQLVVLTGVSGSGKSSLAFDTLYAEGQRRYVESLSSYARQFLGQMEKPLYDTIRGLSPTIAIQQKTASSNPRSTVGTITEIADYLRVLYARVGEQHCHQCGRRVGGQSVEQIAAELGALTAGTTFQLLSPVLVNRKGEHRELLADLRRRGFVRLRIDGVLQRSEAVTELSKRHKHDVDVVIDRFVAGRVEPSRLTESVELGLKTGEGTLKAEIEGKDRIYSSALACPDCKISFPPLTPQSFSFNSPQGMCPACQGLGSRLAIDPGLLIPDPTLSLDQGAILAWGPDVSQKSNWAHDFRAQIVKHLQISTNTPWRGLSDAQKRRLLWGTGERKYRVLWQGKSGQGHFEVRWEGLIPRLMRRYAQTKSERAKQQTARFIAQTACDACDGSRLRADSRAVLLAGHGLEALSRQTIDATQATLGGLQLTESQSTIAAELLKEIQGRLRFLTAVGLGYLSLDRGGPSLSGGEAQRIRLASQVGSELTGVTYVLDEPSIGLHPKDNAKLIATLEQMRDIGNTVLVVEHDEDTIRAADHVIDFGPGAGIAGGQVVHAGNVASLMRCNASLTGQYLSGRLRVSEPSRARTGNGGLKIEGAQANNLQNLSLTLPLETLTVVTGASGAGKSTLINDVLYPALSGLLEGRPLPRLCRLEGHERIVRVINVDQKPIGRTPRSNPATYIKVFDEIRELYAQLPLARARGYAAGRFSFNVEGGRCEGCQGDGVRKIEMHFLADVFVRCEECGGKRFNSATLEVRYRERSIADALTLTIDEATELFASLPRLAGPLALLQEVGLGYLQLGQPSPTLSGGEAQRIKLARELVKKTSGGCLYILDEPTTGLHFHDTGRLITVLQKLVDLGNTVVVIEHNLDLVSVADHVIDLGPGGGPEGGHLVAQGSPAEVARVTQSATGRYLDRLFTSRQKKRVPRPRLSGGRERLA